MRPHPGRRRLGPGSSRAVGAINESVPWPVTVVVNAVVCFVMFTVSHDASHYSISRIRWVNSLFGRLSFCS